MADHLVALDDIEGMRYCEGKARDLHGRLHYQEAVDMMADPNEALVLLDRLESSIGAQANTRWVRRLEGALACLRLGERDHARELVEEALRIVQGMGVPDLSVTSGLADWGGPPWKSDANRTRPVQTHRVAASPPPVRPFTLLLRLLPSQGIERRLVGQAVVVDSGEIVPIADQSDLLGLVERLSSGPADDP